MALYKQNSCSINMCEKQLILDYHLISLIQVQYKLLDLCMSDNMSEVVVVNPWIDNRNDIAMIKNVHV